MIITPNNQEQCRIFWHTQGISRAGKKIWMSCIFRRNLIRLKIKLIWEVVEKIFQKKSDQARVWISSALLYIPSQHRGCVLGFPANLGPHYAIIWSLIDFQSFPGWFNINPIYKGFSKLMKGKCNFIIEVMGSLDMIWLWHI